MSSRIRFPGSRGWVWASLAAALAVLAILALSPLGCGHSEPIRPQGDGRDYTAPPPELPDEFPGGEASDSSNGGGPGLPPEEHHMWVRMRAFHDPMRPDLGIWIMNTGEAAAISPGESLRVIYRLQPDSVELVASWFVEARFHELAGEYVSENPVQVRIYEVMLQDAPTGVVSHMIGEESLMPEELRTLVGRLEWLGGYVMEHGEPMPEPPEPPPPPPPPPPVYVHGDLSIEPVSAPPGTPRAIRLYLRNAGTEAVTLHFRTGQLYDFILMSEWPWGPPPPGDPGGGPGGPDDPGCPGGGPGNPGDPGRPPHGLRGDEPSEPGDPGDPTDPPDSTVTPGDTIITPPPPPDSGWVPPDSGWVPPDSGWVPPPDTIPPGEPRFLWNWAFGRGFPEVLTEVVLEPGEVKIYEESWNGNDNEGQVVGPGTYVLEGVILSDPWVQVFPARVEVTE